MNSQKCHFLKKDVTFLGYRVSCTGLTIDPKKLSAIAQMSAPKNLKELRGTLGLFNFFGRFICGYSINISVFHDLLTTNEDYLWRDVHELAFQDLKQRMLSGPILSFYDASKPLLVISDSSFFSLGYIIVQESENKNTI